MTSQELLDFLIIGAGPAGLSAADAAASEGLTYLVIEKGTIANTIRQYPVGRTMFSTPNELEMREGSLHPVRDKPTREELLSHYIHFVLEHDLRVTTGEEVTDVKADHADGFIVQRRCRCRHAVEQEKKYRARNVLFACGAMKHRRRLNIPRNDLAKVGDGIAGPA